MNKMVKTIVILILLGVPPSLQSQQPHFATTGTGISVRLRQPSGPFAAGEPIRVLAELSNDGNQTLLVCRDVDITSDFCHWEFESRDASGRVSPGLGYAADRFPNAPAPFPNALISNWIALAPKYEYETKVSLELAFPSKPKPGHYAVRAIFTSDGPSSQSVYNDLVHYPSELAALPYPGWKGKAVSNWVSITIVAPK